MDLYTYASDEISVGGLSLDYGIPWILTTDLDSSLVYAVEEGSLAYTRISGIDVAVDVGNTVGDPLSLVPGQTGTRSMFLAAVDGPSGTEPLAELNPEPLPELTYTLSEVTGTVVDAAGDLAGEVEVMLEARAPDAEWGTLDLTCTDEVGAFSMPVPDFSGWDFRLVARGEGRDDGSELGVVLGGAVELDVSQPGRLAYAVDEDGDPSPGRVALTRDDGESMDLWVVG
ncbi:MAG: hypothetical protein GY884_15360, partial [Proteobacteria bacterium]|nr:hypothetical protein [Pseudomonadota bacterium]